MATSRPVLTKLHSDDDTLNRVQDHIVQTLNPVLANPLLSATNYRFQESTPATPGAATALQLQRRSAAATWATILSFGAVRTDITQEPWTSVSGGVGFQNGWVDLTATGFNACGYFKDSTGRIWLRGCAQTGTLNSVLFTLPVGYRPAKKVAYAVDSNGAFGGVLVDAVGNVSQYAGVNTSLFLDGISFDPR